MNPLEALQPKTSGFVKPPRDRRDEARSMIRNALSAVAPASPAPAVEQFRLQDGKLGLPSQVSKAKSITGNAALDWLISKESGGRTNAKNPKSSAFGLGQLTKTNRIKYAAQLGIQDPDTTDYNSQLRMMNAYIRDRYGTPEAAVKFWQRNGWY